jgi:hypothetical protein
MSSTFTALAVTQISVTGFSADQSGGTPAIQNYNGLPLYCHVTDAGPSLYSMLINTSGPSSFAPGTGDLQLVTFVYDPQGAGTPPMTFPVSGAFYNGQPSDLSLQFTSPTTATLVVAQQPGPQPPPPKPAAAAGDIATITTVKISATHAGTLQDIMFFVNIPLPNNHTVTAGDTWTASVKWTGGLGGAIGPVGNFESP